MYICVFVYVCMIIAVSIKTLARMRVCVYVCEGVFFCLFFLDVRMSGYG